MRSEAKFSSPTSDLSSLIHKFASIWLVIILATQLPKIMLTIVHFVSTTSTSFFPPILSLLF